MFWTYLDLDLRPLRHCSAPRQLLHHAPPGSSILGCFNRLVCWQSQLRAVIPYAVHPFSSRSTDWSSTVDPSIQRDIGNALTRHSAHMPGVGQSSLLNLLHNISGQIKLRSDILVTPSVSPGDSEYSSEDCHFKNKKTLLSVSLNVQVSELYRRMDKTSDW